MQLNTLAASLSKRKKFIKVPNNLLKWKLDRKETMRKMLKSFSLPDVFCFEEIDRIEDYA